MTARTREHVSLTRGLRWACAAAAAVASFVLADRLFARGIPAGIIASGVVFGSLNALVAVGLVLVYRSHRVINFAQAELGMVAAVVGIHVAVAYGVNWFVAAAIAVMLGAVIGAVIEVAILRRFAKAPRLLVAVATIGLAQVLTGLAFLLPGWLGSPTDLSGFRVPLDVEVNLAPITFGGSDVFAVAIVPVVLGIIALALGRTDRGLALRAVPDNPERAFLVGMPVRSLATLAVASAGALSALAAIVRVPVLSYIGFEAVVAGGPSLLLATLAAGVIGRMRSLPVTATAAVGLGIVGSVAAWITSNTAVVDTIVVAIILVTLAARARDRASRIVEDALGSWRALKPVRPIPRELRSLPEVRVTRAGVFVAMAAFTATLPLWASPSQEQIAGLIAIYALIGVSLVVLTGWAGQISLGQFAFAGAGAATSGVLIARHGWDMVAALAAGAAVAAVLALVVGAPALRARGPFLAVTTLGLAIAGAAFLFDQRTMPWWIERNVERPLLLGRFAIDAEWAMYLLALVVLGLSIIAARNLRGSAFGRSILAVRDNRPAAEQAGIHPLRATTAAFAFSGALAGLAGGLYVLHQGGIAHQAFPPGAGINVFAMAVIGGLGSMAGPLIGAAYVVGASTWLDGGWALLGTGAGMLLLLMFAPGGLGDLVFRARDALLRATARRRGLTVASMIADEGRVRDAAPVVRTRVESPLLACRDLHVSRDGVGVVFGVDLDVARGEIVAILGTNGSGKSTLLKAISGLLDPDAGTVEFDGRRLNDRARGIAAVPGGHGIFPTLTVRENLQAATWTNRRDPAGRARAITEALSIFPVLRARATQQAGSLSGGEQQMLSLAQAFVSEPTALLIDELSLGLSPSATESLYRVVASLNAAGVTIVLVEQSPALAVRLARRAIFLEKGRVRFDGPIDELLARADLVRAVYIPDGIEHPMPSRSTPSAEDPATALEARGVGKAYGGIAAVAGVDLAVRRGEILGLIGTNGAGKTTVLDLLSGAVRPDEGAVVLGGADVTRWSPTRRARAGIARSFQDSRLWSSLTVREVIAVALHRHAQITALVPSMFRIPAVVASERALNAQVDELIGAFGLAAFADKFMSELSTGSRRIVDLAGMVGVRPAVLLLDEPSSGLAQKESEALLPLLRSVHERTGCAMVVVEHHMPLIASLADRLVAMESGRVVAQGRPVDVLEDPAVIASILGAPADERAGLEPNPAPTPSRSRTVGAATDVRPSADVLTW